MIKMLIFNKGRNRIIIRAKDKKYGVYKNEIRPINEN